MKRNCMTVLVTLVLMLAAVLPAIAEDNPTLLTIYEGPKTMTSSQIATASVSGNDLFVYDVMVNHEHIWNANTQPARTPMTYFDFEGRVRIEVTMAGLEKPGGGPRVRPQSYG